MNEFTSKLWNKQNQHTGDRERLFASVALFVGDPKVLYPGSYIDVAASFAFSSVTYVDSDARAAKFFTDQDGVDELIASHRSDEFDWKFIGGDYRSELDTEPVDLLVSLYAGFVSKHCTRYLNTGGWLLANPSHGDVAMASITPGYELAAVVRSGRGNYQVSDKNFDRYLIPKKDTVLTEESIESAGRGVAYTKPAFAYLFRYSP